MVRVLSMKNEVPNMPFCAGCKAQISRHLIHRQEGNQVWCSEGCYNSTPRFVAIPREPMRIPKSMIALYEEVSSERTP